MFSEENRSIAWNILTSLLVAKQEELNDDDDDDDDEMICVNNDVNNTDVQHKHGSSINAVSSSKGVNNILHPVNISIAFKQLTIFPHLALARQLYR